MKDHTQELTRLAEAIGFSYIKEVNMQALIPRNEVRAMCRENRCQRYKKSWSCPPSPICGSPERMRERFAAYSHGLLVQTCGRMADAFDMDIIRETEKRQKRNFDALVRQTGLLGVSCLPLSSGSCTRCRKCTYPDRPCRFPDRLYPSMEACGLWVSEVCSSSGLDYKHGENTITYTACLLFDQKTPEIETDHRERNDT